MYKNNYLRPDDRLLKIIYKKYRQTLTDKPGITLLQKFLYRQGFIKRLMRCLLIALLTIASIKYFETKRFLPLFFFFFWC